MDILYKVNKTIKINNFEQRIDVNLLSFISPFYCQLQLFELYAAAVGSNEEKQEAQAQVFP